MITRKEFLEGSLGVLGVSLLGATWTACATSGDPGSEPDDAGTPETDAATALDSSSGEAASDARVDGPNGDAADGSKAVCTQDIQAVIDDSLPLTVKNHGHEVIVTASDIRLGAERGYDLVPGVHGSLFHQVVVTAEHFEGLKRGETVRIQTTSREGHSHTVVLQCAP